MKRFTRITMVAAAAVLTLAMTTGSAHAQRMGSGARSSPSAKVSSTLGTVTVIVDYSRPGVKGRTIWGELVPYDAVWRAGANEVTTVEFTGNVKVNGQDLRAGRYGFHLLPRANGTWTAIFTDRPGPYVWGIPYQEGHEVLRVDIQARRSTTHVEWLMYSFRNLKPAVPTSGELVLSWELLEVPLMIDAGGM